MTETPAPGAKPHVLHPAAAAALAAKQDRERESHLRGCHVVVPTASPDVFLGAYGAHVLRLATAADGSAAVSRVIAPLVRRPPAAAAAADATSADAAGPDAASADAASADAAAAPAQPASAASSPRVQHIACHVASNRVALVRDDKQLEVWSDADRRRVMVRECIKRPVACAISPDGGWAIVGDKFGDVYGFRIDDAAFVDAAAADALDQATAAAAAAKDPHGRLMLGHVSNLTAVAVAPRGDYLVTAERDEKVRVTQWPMTYAIQSMCFGYHAYVGAVATAQGATAALDAVISSGGDGAVLLHALATGARLAPPVALVPPLAQAGLMAPSAAVDVSAVFISGALNAMPSTYLAIVLVEGVEGAVFVTVRLGEGVEGAERLQLLQYLPLPALPLSAAWNAASSAFLVTMAVATDAAMLTDGLVRIAVAVAADGAVSLQVQAAPLTAAADAALPAWGADVGLQLHTGRYMRKGLNPNDWRSQRQIQAAADGAAADGGAQKRDAEVETAPAPVAKALRTETTASPSATA